MSSTTHNADKKYLTIIAILSVAIPAVVAILLFMPQSGKLGNIDVSMLPHLNAFLNSGTALCLFGAFYAIGNKNIVLHRNLMLSAFSLSSVFLVSYVVYHFQSVPTHYGGEGVMRIIYFFLLISHILLAIAVVPLVLLALYFAISQQIERHKKIVKFAYPVWTYVAVTGVIVYLMISPYYQS